jgi:hypothetical protein
VVCGDIAFSWGKTFLKSNLKPQCSAVAVCRCVMLAVKDPDAVDLWPDAVDSKEGITLGSST